MIKTISSKKPISKSLLYPSKESFIVKKFGDHWEIHDLSLSDILGVGKSKKAKKPIGVAPKKSMTAKTPKKTTDIKDGGEK
ncbi:MAG: hypothetical protein ACFE8P_06735 [Promethearchaeota archaeon]